MLFLIKYDWEKFAVFGEDVAAAVSLWRTEMQTRVDDFDDSPDRIEVLYSDRVTVVRG